MSHKRTFLSVLAAGAMFCAANVAFAGSQDNTNVNISRDGDGNLAANRNESSSATVNGNANSNDDGSGGSASASASASAVSISSGAGGGSSDVTVDGDEAAVSSAAPVFLSTGDDVCMGSGGLGVQGVDFGVSVSSTWTDANCVMLKNARELKNQGHDKAAKARLCMNDENAMAFELAGEPCPRALASTQRALAKIREWNPQYMAAAAPGAQYAAIGHGAPAAGEQVAVVGAAGAQDDAVWLSSGFGSFFDAIKAAFERLASGASAGGSANGSAYSLDGIE